MQQECSKGFENEILNLMDLPAAEDFENAAKDGRPGTKCQQVIAVGWALQLQLQGTAGSWRNYEQKVHVLEE